MTERGKVASTRRALLRQAVAAGDKEALDAFWRAVAAQGTPLIEADEERAGFSLVTFLWRGTAGSHRG